NFGNSPQVKFAIGACATVSSCADKELAVVGQCANELHGAGSKGSSAIRRGIPQCLCRFAVGDPNKHLNRLATAEIIRRVEDRFCLPFSTAQYQFRLLASCASAKLCLHLRAVING